MPSVQKTGVCQFQCATALGLLCMIVEVTNYTALWCSFLILDYVIGTHGIVHHNPLRCPYPAMPKLPTRMLANPFALNKWSCKCLLP